MLHPVACTSCSCCCHATASGPMHSDCALAAPNLLSAFAGCTVVCSFCSVMFHPVACTSCSCCCHVTACGPMHSDCALAAPNLPSAFCQMYCSLLILFCYVPSCCLHKLQLLLPCGHRCGPMRFCFLSEVRHSDCSSLCFIPNVA